MSASKEDSEPVPAITVRGLNKDQYEQIGHAMVRAGLRSRASFGLKLFATYVLNDLGFDETAWTKGGPLTAELASKIIPRLNEALPLETLKNTNSVTATLEQLEEIEDHLESYLGIIRKLREAKRRAK